MAQARFGFFDLDATFSAAFILIMAAYLEGRSGCRQPTDLQEAIVVLEYLSDEGNRVARQRLTDIKEFASQVMPAEEMSDHGRRENHTVNQDGLDSLGLWNHISNTHDRDASAVHDFEKGYTEPPMTHGDVSVELGNVDMMGDMELNLDWEASGIFSSFHDPGLPVTGVDRVDWEEMERMFATREF